MYKIKASLKNAADASALAAARELPDVAKANDVAKTVAVLNGLSQNMVTIESPYENDATKIKVTCTQRYSFNFAKVLGDAISPIDISASAVVKKGVKAWSGQALPFLNLGYDYTNLPVNKQFKIWTSVAPGDKELISDWSFSNNSFVVDYKDGVTLKTGYANGLKGLDGSTLKDGLDIILADVGTQAYVISLKADIIQQAVAGQAVIKIVGDNKLKTLKQLKQGDVIDPSQLILLECIYNSCDLSNQHNIVLTYSGNSYDIMNGVLPGGGGSGSGKSKLIK